MKIGLRKMRFASILVLLAAFVTGGYLVQQNAFAATGQIYLTPSSPSVNHGSNLRLNLRINPGTAVDSVTATVNFDSSKLKYVSIDTSSSAFGTSLQQSIGSSTITISRGDFSGGISSDSLVAGITFESLVYDGSTSVTLTNANASAAGQGSYTNPSVGNATVNLNPGSCPSGQTGTPPDCTTTSTGGGGSGSGGGTSGGTDKPKGGDSGGSTTPKGGSSSSGGSTSSGTSNNPKTSATPAVKAAKIGFTNLDVSFTTSKVVRVYLEYGTTDKLGQQTALGAKGKTHSFKLGKSVILPGVTYYYRAVSRDSNGKLTTGDIQTVTAKGMSVRVKVVDKDAKPLADKQVTLHSDPITVSTDGNGYANFTNVTPGNHKLIFTDDKKTYSQPITVANNVTTVNGEEVAPLQNFSVVYSLTQPTLASRLLPVVVFVVVAGLAYYVYRTRKNSSGGIGGHPLDPDLVVVGGAGQAVEPVAHKSVIEPQPEPVAPQATAAPQPQISSTFLNNPPAPAQPSSVVTPSVNKIEVK